MGRSTKAGNPGHNSNAPLTDDDKAALQQYFSLKIRGAQVKATQAKASYDIERNAVNSLFSSARGELQMTRKEFEEVLALQDMNEAEFLNHEAKRTARMARQGLPVGTQLDMFAQQNDAADDQARAHADGLRAGRRADDPELPGHVSSMFMDDWMRGYHEGQAENGALLSKAEAILESRKAKTVELKPEEAEDEDGEELTPAAIDAGVKALKKSDFMKPSAAEEQVGQAA